MKEDIKTKTKAQRLVEDVISRATKENIPLLMVIGDREKGDAGIVMDGSDKSRDLNISLLLDAMLNNDEGSKPLINVVLGVSAILLATMPQMEELFVKKLKDMKASQKEAVTIKQTAEA